MRARVMGPWAGWGMGVVLIMGWGTGRAQPLCTNILVKLEERRGAGKIELTVTNLQTVEVTVTLDVTTWLNMRGSAALPLTVVVPAASRMPLLSVWPADPRTTWRYRYQFQANYGNAAAKHDDRYRYRLPYSAGTRYRVVQGYNGKFSHSGDNQYAIDWQMPEGTPILAAREGVVAAVEQNSTLGGPDRTYLDCANFVMVRHPDGTLGHYVHLLRQGVKVRAGQIVHAGDLIGLSGNTGFSRAPHLHFSVFKAKNGRERETIQVQFKTDQGELKLEEGRMYGVAD